eukprot:CAMPEP_0178450760 /NCGR_PEP_ID=MMETSP0689_2-20121128/43303_1 /TAXON_ID=160604 /ORGANISM="Amphidinium massartii, Strain CS-259" /LENGTH=163 /DNA_ID=CAMNT_0020076261 /DNA_START=208 /DNA_END=695 /DNA_ORIENTATION=-
MIGDILQVYRCCFGYRMSKSATGPEPPDLPLVWHVVVLTIEVIAVLCLLIGFALLFGCLLTGLFGGAYVLLHLRYYSGTTKENAHTLLPTLSLFIIVVATAVSSTDAERWIVYFGMGRWVAFLVMLAMIPIGMVFGFLLLKLLGQTQVTSDECLPITAEQKAS